MSVSTLSEIDMVMNLELVAFSHDRVQDIQVISSVSSDNKASNQVAHIALFADDNKR